MVGSPRSRSDHARKTRRRDQVPVWSLCAGRLVRRVAQGPDPHQYNIFAVDTDPQTLAIIGGPAARLYSSNNDAAVVPARQSW
jgi:hypothetical protein